ncbi:MAG: hypothetical protein AB8B54_14720 [Sphingorhabdus sp.]
MKLLKFLSPLVLIFCSVISPTKSFANTSDILAKVERAYGGQKLRYLKSISIESDRRLGFANTGYATDLTEFIPDSYQLQIDLINQRGSVERYVHQNGNVFHDRTVSESVGVAQINYMLNRKTLNPEGSFFGSFGFVFRISDTLLAYALINNSSRTTLKGETFYRNSKQSIIGFTLPGSDSPLDIYVDQNSGLIQRLHRQLDERELVYLFRDFQKQDGITFAAESQVFLNGELFDYEIRKSVSTNNVSSSAFTIEGALQLHKEKNENQISAIKIDKNTYHVGSGIRFSTFVDMGDYILATGANDGFRNRYKVFREAHGSDKPLRYLLLSHHHEAARSGYKDALGMGAKLLVSASVLPIIEEAIGKDRAAATTQKITDGQQMGDVIFRLISTTHTSDLIVAYLPKLKILLQEDHYRPVFDGPPQHLFDSTISFIQNVDALGLEIDTLLSAHGAKQEKWSVLRDVMNSKPMESCRYDRVICTN